MRHQKSGRKFSRTSAHRDAMFTNMAASLIKHGLIRTTTIVARLGLLAGIVLGAAHRNARASDLQAGYLFSGKAFRAATAKVLPSIVQIESFGGLSGRAAGSRRAGGVSGPGEGTTTGLIISPQGHIVTSTFNFLRKPPVITN